jgi:hypothetical protein
MTQLPYLRRKVMLRTLVISAATIGLSGVLMTAPAIAGHKPNHNPGGGGGGGDATYAITLTDDAFGDEVAAGDGVEGAGGTIEGITDAGSFDAISLDLISTQSGSGNIQADYNAFCGDVVNPVGGSEAIDNIEVLFNAEIDTLTVVVEYMVETQSFTLLLEGPHSGDFPPIATTSYDLTMWNNRGGGKGKKNRCGSGPQSLDGVTLEIMSTSP